MNASEIIAALDLPATSRVDQRVPKKLLLENGAPTTGDKRHINEGVEELFWVAALKPTTIGVPEHRDETREYLEIAVLRLALRPGARAGRLVDLVHRAVPYPVLLVTEQADRPSVSAAHKRWSQGEAGKTVLEGEVIAAEWKGGDDPARWQDFLGSLGLAHQPRTSLYALYQGWIDTLLALHAARVTGNFAVPASPDHAAARRDALQECARLETEITRIRSSAVKEKQLPRRVELNLELKRLQAAQAAARGKL
jgi:hypothetical protein